MSDDIRHRVVAATAGISDARTDTDSRAPSQIDVEIDAMRLISLGVVCQVLGDCSPMTIWRRRQKDPTFPKAIRLSSGNAAPLYFRLADFRRWLADRATDAQPPSGATVLGSDEVIRTAGRKKAFGPPTEETPDAN